MGRLGAFVASCVTEEEEEEEEDRDDGAGNRRMSWACGILIATASRGHGHKNGRVRNHGKAHERHVMTEVALGMGMRRYKRVYDWSWVSLVASFLRSGILFMDALGSLKWSTFTADVDG